MAERFEDLAHALKDPQPEVRHMAALALWRIGPEAAPAASALTAALRDPDAEVRHYAASALARIKAP